VFQGKSCNVAKGADVAALADYAADQLGRVDLWINNAGTNAYKYTTLTNSVEEDLVSIVETNVLGVMLCCREVSLSCCLGTLAEEWWK
jgi:chlorophyll(ide) b reductase